MNSFTVLCLVASVVALTQGNPTTPNPTSSSHADGVSAGSTVSGVSKSPEEVKQKIKEQVEALTGACKSQTKITGEQAKIVATQAIPKTEAEKVSPEDGSSCDPKCCY